MKHHPIHVAVALVFGAALVLAGCEDTPKPKAKTTQSAPPTVGREYGETLHGAVTQAHQAAQALEQSNQKLDHANDPGE